MDEKWYVTLLCRTGNSRDGTLAHRWTTRSTRSYRCGDPTRVGTLYDTPEEATAVASRLTDKNAAE